jgi:rhodanese-related sulfurtransferase
MKKTKKKRSKAHSRRPFPIWGWVLLILGALIAVGGAILLLQPKTESAQSLPLEITVAQAGQKRGQGAFFLDVREPSEWAQFHIQGATLIPLESLSSRLSEVPRDRQVVVYCRTGVRSAQGRDILLNAGYKQVTSLQGGITQWQAQGMPVVTGQ